MYETIRPTTCGAHLMQRTAIRPAMDATFGSATADSPVKLRQWTLAGFDGRCRVTTDFGNMPVMGLRVRDRVKTISGTFREVKWIDDVRLDAAFLARHPEAQPMMIRAKALGGLFPSDDMMLSPAQEIWVPDGQSGHGARPAASLEAQPGIRRHSTGEITYYRFHLGAPETVCIEGAWFCVKPEN